MQLVRMNHIYAIIALTSFIASLLSWEYPYEGDTVAIFESHIELYFWPFDPFNAPYVSIIQSSGCGKSRLADEFAKYHFSIPMNLRNPQAKGEIRFILASRCLCLRTGFPPSDEALYTYFRQIPLIAGQGNAFVCMSAFVVALLDTAKEAVEHWPRGSDESVAQ